MYGPTDGQLYFLTFALVFIGAILGGGFVGILWWIFG